MVDGEEEEEGGIRWPRIGTGRVSIQSPNERPGDAVVVGLEIKRTLHYRITVPRHIPLANVLETYRESLKALVQLAPIIDVKPYLRSVPHQQRRPLVLDRWTAEHGTVLLQMAKLVGCRPIQVNVGDALSEEKARQWLKPEEGQVLSAATAHAKSRPSIAPKRVLLCCSGSIATIKLPLMVEALRKDGIDLQVVLTRTAEIFLKDLHLDCPVWRDRDEWDQWTTRTDPILHIELRRWAEIILVAPASANTIAKMVHGICDNLLTSLLRATPPRIPVLVFPAMNSEMWTHPLTAKQIYALQTEMGYEIHGPIIKGLACGDEGMGAMTEWSDIVEIVRARCAKAEENGCGLAPSDAMHITCTDESMDEQDLMERLDALMDPEMVKWLGNRVATGALRVDDSCR